jgi:hypothetical protein
MGLHLEGVDTEKCSGGLAAGHVDRIFFGGREAGMPEELPVLEELEQRVLSPGYADGAEAR